MKIWAKKINMIALFTPDKKPKPLRFQIKLKDQDEMVTIKIDKINYVTNHKNAGRLSLIYECQSEINGVVKLYEIRYKINEYLWELYKM